MTDKQALKQIVRARAERTGESYVTARRHVTTQLDGDTAAATYVQQQAERYLDLGIHDLSGITERDFRSRASKLTRGVAGLPASTAEDENNGRIPWLLVVTGLDPNALMPLVHVSGKQGYVDMSPSTPDRFPAIEAVTVPDAAMYLLRDFDPGDALRNLPPSEAMTRIKTEDRQPLTIDEAVCAAVLRPDLLKNKHAFSILASRSADKAVVRSVPALWISRGAPRLGWCWNENPHTWLGSGSCAERLTA